MRVAMVSEHVRVADLARAVAAGGHEVRIYARRATPDVAVQVTDGVTVEYVPVGPATPLPADGLLPLVGEFGRRLAARWGGDGFRPDVVHAHSWLGGLAALTATAGDRRPVVVTFHALGDPRSGPANRPGLERTLGQLADLVIARCAAEAEELTRIGVPRTNVHIVPSGVDTDRFTPDGPAVARTAGLRRILSVGPLGSHTGHDDLIGALRRVPAAEAVIAGGPAPDRLDADPDAGRLRAAAGRAGVADRVRILGAVPAADLPAWYRSADLVCCASRDGAFDGPPVEAMACGVPVVTYAVGAPGESVIDGVTGVHVRPGDLGGLVGALRGLLTDDMRRVSYASAAVDRARSRYPLDRAAQDIGRVYRTVLSRAGSPTALLAD